MPPPTDKSKSTKTSKSAPSGKQRRLGRGLSSLMRVDEKAPATIETPGSDPSQAGQGPTTSVQTALIDPNPHQPRKKFGPAALSELAASIRTNGIIQPLVVRPAAEGRFELVAGERRLRAAKLAELAEVPVVVRSVDPLQQAEMALVENVQREDLNPIDRAEAYRELLDRMGLTQTELAERVGEDRSTVANHLRLLELADPVRELVRSGELGLGHAKVLAGVADQAEQARLAELTRGRGLSVRNLERLLEAPVESARRDEAAGGNDSRRRYLDRLSDTLAQHVGSRCSIQPAGKSGYKLTLHLKNVEQFDRLMDQLGVEIE
jgi:ParB family chromosome partitioning protein